MCIVRLFFLLVLCLCGFQFESEAVMSSQKVRHAVVSGAFYPADKDELRSLIGRYLNNVPEQNIPDTVSVLIAPHAGYIYSGQVAAYAYKCIENKKYDAVFVLAPSHYHHFAGASIFDGNSYETPLGSIPLATDIIEELKKTNPLISYHAAAHTREHSLEVHLPFLQVVLGSDFSLVPIVMGDAQYETARSVAESISLIAQKKNVLVVASTDLSHFLKYDEAVSIDRYTVENLSTVSAIELSNFFKMKPESACGKNPILTALLYAGIVDADKRHVLYYANSGDSAGDKNRVVGYVSMAITGKGEKTMERKDAFSKESKNELFKLVRATIAEKLETGSVGEAESSNPELQDKNGAFVTLHTKDGSLRGCIGNFVSNQPLYKTVQEMALAAAFRDPRFSPVLRDELDDLTIEISVLSPMKKIDDVKKIELGKHGIYIKKGFQSGTFLPQVATETGWNLEEFLGHCARDKAGIGWDGWKNADIYIYTANVFSEDENKK